jgi:hypothetical protein
LSSKHKRASSKERTQFTLHLVVALQAYVHDGSVLLLSLLYSELI